MELDERIQLMAEALRVSEEWLLQGWDGDYHAELAFMRLDEIMGKFLEAPDDDPGRHQARAVFHLMAAITWNVGGEIPQVSFDDHVTAMEEVRAERTDSSS